MGRKIKYILGVLNVHSDAKEASASTNMSLCRTA